LAAYSEITIEQYASFSSTINVEDTAGDAINLYGYSASSQLRKSFYSTTATNFTVSVTGTANGEVTISMTSANTANLTPGRYMYDVIITSPQSVTTRVVEGIVVVAPGVTRI
jgi:hypothetical protein